MINASQSSWKFCLTLDMIVERLLKDFVKFSDQQFIYTSELSLELLKCYWPTIKVALTIVRCHCRGWLRGKGSLMWPLYTNSILWLEMSLNSTFYWGNKVNYSITSVMKRTKVALEIISKDVRKSISKMIKIFGIHFISFRTQRIIITMENLQK